MEMEEVVEEWRRSGGVVVVGRQGSIPMLANTKVKCRFPGFVWRRGKGLVCMVCFFFLSFAFALPACAVAILICRGPGTTLDVGSPSQCTHNNGLSSPGRRAKLCSYSLVTSPFLRIPGKDGPIRPSVGGGCTSILRVGMGGEVSFLFPPSQDVMGGLSVSTGRQVAQVGRCPHPLYFL